MLVRHRRMLRLALGTTLSFVTAEMLDWELSFVITVFLVQLLAGSGPGARPAAGDRDRPGPRARHGRGRDRERAPRRHAGPVRDRAGLVLFLAFVLQRSGRSPALGTLILVAFGLLPVVAVQAPELVPAVAFYLVRSAAVAVLWVWLLHALLPDPECPLQRRPVSGRVGAASAGVDRAALTDTAVLLPVLLAAMTLEVPAALVIVLTVTAILPSIMPAAVVALGLLLGNLLGGLTAMIAYELLSAVPTLGFLTALLLLVSLFYARADRESPRRWHRSSPPRSSRSSSSSAWAWHPSSTSPRPRWRSACATWRSPASTRSPR